MLGVNTQKKRVRKQNKELHGHMSELHTRVQRAPTTPAIKRLKVGSWSGKGRRVEA